MLEFRPIETQYKGYRFRSRLEARWAVFFDALRLKWEYEREGYELGDGTRYLPDFWLPLALEYHCCWGFFIEIKADAPTDEERRKLQLLVKGTGYTAACFWGMPDENEWHATIYKGEQGGECYIETGKLNMELVGFLSDLDADNISRFHHLPFGYQFAVMPDQSKRNMLRKAFIAAKSARFEYGETPNG